MNLPGLPKIDIQKKLPVIIALIVAIIAVVLANSYLTQKKTNVAQRSRVQSNERIEKVLIAKKDISASAVIQENMLAVREVPEQFIQPRAATAADGQRVIGKRAIAPISKGGQILLTNLDSAQRVRGGGNLAALTPPGKRAITIPVDNISSVGGMIRPQDFVDILGVVPQQVEINGEQVTQYMTVPLFQKVLVLAVGSFTGAVTATGKKDGQILISTITIALPPEEATMLAFVQEQGKLRFVLRSPADPDTAPAKPAAWDTLFMYLFPEMVARMQNMEKEPEDKEEKLPEVEIYRGDQREIKTLTY